jgi:hypothetical protein
MRKHGVVRSVAVTSTATQILGPSEQRVALLFSPPTTGNYTVSTDPNVALGTGLNLMTTTPAILITIELFGDAVKKPWFAIGPAGGLTAGILETIEE